MTKNRKIGGFQVRLLENYLVLGFSKEWMKFFRDKPFFDVEVDNKGRLVLKGPKIIDPFSGSGRKTSKEFSPTGE
jgi:hypothetical protein